MRIHGLTVCVDYSDFLALSIDRWARGLESLTVVSNTRDTLTGTLVARFENGPAGNATVDLHRTDVFYASGAAFNKGAAMEEARRAIWTRQAYFTGGNGPAPDDWLLLIDADVVPPGHWRDLVNLAAPIPGMLYGARRRQCDDPAFLLTGQPVEHLPMLEDDVAVGFFQLFGMADPTADVPDLIDSFWLHAGNYDDRLKERWPRERRALIPGLELVHVGQRENWFGRGRHAEWQAMQAERRRRGGRWDHERIA